MNTYLQLDKKWSFSAKIRSSKIKADTATTSSPEGKTTVCPLSFYGLTIPYRSPEKIYFSKTSKSKRNYKQRRLTEAGSLPNLRKPSNYPKIKLWLSSRSMSNGIKSLFCLLRIYLQCLRSICVLPFCLVAGVRLHTMKFSFDLM